MGETDDSRIDEASFGRLLVEVIERARAMHKEAEGVEARSAALVVTNLEQAALWHCEYRASLHLGENSLTDWLLEI